MRDRDKEREQHKRDEAIQVRQNLVSRAWHFVSLVYNFDSLKDVRAFDRTINVSAFQCSSFRFGAQFRIELEGSEEDIAKRKPLDVGGKFVARG